MAPDLLAVKHGSYAYVCGDIYLGTNNWKETYNYNKAVAV
jgi:hypothetical protein